MQARLVLQPFMTCPSEFGAGVARPTGALMPWQWACGTLAGSSLGSPLWVVAAVVMHARGALVPARKQSGDDRSCLNIRSSAL